MTDPHPEPRVQFLIAGVQKGGTTALADYLRQHPQLHSHFLSVAPLPPMQRLQAQLQELFNPEISQLEHLLGWDLSAWRR